MTSEVVVPTGAGVLRPFVDAGVFDAGEVQLCAVFARLGGDVTDEVLLALAVAARGPRRGHVCVDLADVSTLIVDANDERTEGLPWPEADRWAAALVGSDLVATPADSLDEPLRPLVWDGRRLYLQRYFHDELTVAGDLVERAGTGRGPTPAPEDAALEAILDGLFGVDDPRGRTCSGGPPATPCTGGSPSSPVVRGRARPAPSPGCWPPPGSSPSVGGRCSTWHWPPPPGRRPAG